jgi:hypothetical protein
MTCPDFSQGACVGEDPLLFDLDAHRHGRLGGHNSCLMCDDARDICGYCPIRVGCLEWGRKIRAHGLIWGGRAFEKGRPRELR